MHDIEILANHHWVCTDANSHVDGDSAVAQIPLKFLRN